MEEPTQELEVVLYYPIPGRVPLPDSTPCPSPPWSYAVVRGDPKYFVPMPYGRVACWQITPLFHSP